MENVVNPGHYLCPRCKSQQVYESQETTGAYAVTLDTPGPINPTFVNRIQQTIMRCINCNEKAIWIDSPEAIAAKNHRDSVGYAWVGFIFGFVFLFLGMYIADQAIDGTTGLMVGSFIGSAIMFLIGYYGYKSASAKK